MIRCGMCHRLKPIFAFARRQNPGKERKRQGRCKECTKKVSRLDYLADKEKYRNNAYIHNERSKAFIAKVKAEASCMDCDEDNPIVLEFDHLPGTEKSFNIGSAPTLGKSVTSIRAEMKKCEIVCANCHRIRTYNRRTVEV